LLWSFKEAPGEGEERGAKSYELGEEEEPRITALSAASIDQEDVSARVDRKPATQSQHESQPASACTQLHDCISRTRALIKRLITKMELQVFNSFNILYVSLRHYGTTGHLGRKEAFSTSMPYIHGPNTAYGLKQLGRHQE